MIEPLSLIASESLRELSKLIAGKLLTETQIQSVSKHIVGKYFTDLLPTPQKEAEAEERISAAKTHIAEATKIVVSLQNDLEKQANQLELLAREIDEKKQVAERYAVLAKTNQDAFAAFKTEMEETVRKELTAQSEQGKALRRTVSFASWFITLVIGAALGALFQIYLEPTVKPPTSQPASTQPTPDQAAPK
jgi:hypothetical protein